MPWRRVVCSAQLWSNLSTNELLTEHRTSEHLLRNEISFNNNTGPPQQLEECWDQTSQFTVKINGLLCSWCGGSCQEWSTLYLDTLNLDATSYPTTCVLDWHLKCGGEQMWAPTSLLRVPLTTLLCVMWCMAVSWGPSDPVMMSWQCDTLASWPRIQCNVHPARTKHHSQEEESRNGIRSLGWCCCCSHPPDP